MTIESSSAAGVDDAPVLPFAFLRGGILYLQPTMSQLIVADLNREFQVSSLLAWREHPLQPKRVNPATTTRLWTKYENGRSQRQRSWESLCDTRSLGAFEILE